MATTKNKYERNLGKLFRYKLNPHYKWYNNFHNNEMEVQSQNEIFFISGLRKRRGMYVYDITLLGESKNTNNRMPIHCVPAIDVDRWLNGTTPEKSLKNDYWSYVEYKHT